MKKIIFIIFSLLLYADVTYIINEITKIEKFKPVFKKIKHYNIFEYETNIATNIPTKNTASRSEKGSFNLKIYAIFQNRVNINGKWFKVGDTINGYKIVKITNNYVYLKRNNKTLKLSITNYILKVNQ